MTTLGRRVGHRRARLIAPASLLPDTGLCHLFSLANSKWLYRHLSVARASSVKRQGAPRAVVLCSNCTNSSEGRFQREEPTSLLRTSSRHVDYVYFREELISQKEAAERMREEAVDAHPLRRRRVTRRREYAARLLALGGVG
ncbi:jg20819 [Pararge aegeria aegeria]|uniref:Jg20819 protein n=1 Tax=Pararge aegeria aegeria TaxID=348720 RepID=A0A8S4R5R0_9NEOP|nr:jg20819 [Pararge aegeria aegeria]